jgi:hypothetical protein
MLGFHAAAREDAEAVAAWERERAGGVKGSSARSGRGAAQRAHGEGDAVDADEDGGGASAGTPLQPLRRAAAVGDYGAAHDAQAVGGASLGHHDAPAAALHVPRRGAGGAGGSRMARMRLLTDEPPDGVMTMQR